MTGTAGALAIFVGSLPIFLALVYGIWNNDRQFARIDKRFEQIERQLDRIWQKLDGIEAKLSAHGERLATLEERDRLIRPGGQR